MDHTWGQGLPALGLYPGEEEGDSAAVESLVPLLPEDLCEKLTWGHQAFHWPWGEGPEGWVVPWDNHLPRLQSPPARAVGAAVAAAADSASFVSASWLRQWLCCISPSAYKCPLLRQETPQCAAEPTGFRAGRPESGLSRPNVATSGALLPWEQPQAQLGAL